MNRLKTITVSLALSLPLFACWKDPGGSDFRFQSIVSLTDMKEYIAQTLPLGTSAETIRGVFVQDGGATLIAHPTKSGVEKYIYDINFCHYYIWRWNISANYDLSGHLRQVYVNGEPVFFSASTDVFDPRSTPKGVKSKIVKMSRPRPEAYKGERTLSYILYDLDGDLQSIDDQQLIGGGPTRSDPLNMGKIHTYEVNPWRSIFNSDCTAGIVEYEGDCTAVDKAMRR